MSLDWNIENIENHKEVCWIDGKMNPVTNTLIWSTISVGLGVIDVNNVDEFAARFRIIEKLDGPFIYKVDDGKKIDEYLSDEDFIAHIGLTTNVVNESRAQWARRIFVTKQTSTTEAFARGFRSGRSRVMKETV